MRVCCVCGKFVAAMFWLMLKPEATEISKQNGKGQNAFIANRHNTQYARLNVVNRGAQICDFLLELWKN